MPPRGALTRRQSIVDARVFVIRAASITGGSAMAAVAPAAGSGSDALLGARSARSVTAPRAPAARARSATAMGRPPVRRTPTPRPDDPGMALFRKQLAAAAAAAGPSPAGGAACSARPQPQPQRRWRRMAFVPARGGPGGAEGGSFSKKPRAGGSAEADAAAAAPSFVVIRAEAGVAPTLQPGCALETEAPAAGAAMAALRRRGAKLFGSLGAAAAGCVLPLAAAGADAGDVFWLALPAPMLPPGAFYAY